MTHDPVAFTARFEASVLRAIEGFEGGPVDERIAPLLAIAIRGAVDEHVDAGTLPVSPEGAERLVRVVATAMSFHTPVLGPVALPEDERERPFAGVSPEDLLVIRERLAGWIGAQADHEAAQMVLEGTIAQLLGAQEGA